MTAASTGRPFWFSTFDQFMNKCITTQWAKTVIRVVWVAQCLIKKPSGCGDPNVYFVSMSILKVARMGHPVLRKRTVPLSPTELNGSEILNDIGLGYSISSQRTNGFVRDHAGV